MDYREIDHEEVDNLASAIALDGLSKSKDTGFKARVYDDGSSTKIIEFDNIFSEEIKQEEIEKRLLELEQKMNNKDTETTIDILQQLENMKKEFQKFKEDKEIQISGTELFNKLDELRIRLEE
jgi:replicative DNA helicase